MIAARFAPIVLNQLAGLILGTAGYKLISNLVEPAIYGKYALFLTLTQVGFLLTHSGLVNHVARYWQRESPQAAQYTRFVWHSAWRQSLGLVPLMLVIVAGLSVSNRTLDWLWVLPMLLISNHATAILNVATSALNASDRHWRSLFLGVLAAGTRALGPVAAVLWVLHGFVGLSLGYAAHGVIVISVIAFAVQHARTETGERQENFSRWIAELRDYGRPFFWLGAWGWCLWSVDRWLAFYFFGEERAGIFNMSLNIAAILPGFLYAGLMQAVFPKMFRLADIATNAGDWRGIARRCDAMTAMFLIAGCVALLLLKLASPYLIGTVLSEKYAESFALLLPAGFAAMTLQINQFYYLLLQGQHNSAAMVRVMACVAGLKVVGGIISALISWQAFLIWLMVGLLMCFGLGRWMIRRIALEKNAST
ncbi:MAG: oligosaccharide flippase family protein [Verrucomicrobia bacterium]|nr:oligosaccharide flippase family protein [Verrucomicrobiota bacterium]